MTIYHDGLLLGYRSTKICFQTPGRCEASEHFPIFAHDLIDRGGHYDDLASAARSASRIIGEIS